MSIEVTCRCGRVLKAAPQYAGRRGRCKGCGATLLIPEPAPEPPPAKPAPGLDDDWPDPAPVAVAVAVADDDADLAAALGTIETADDGDDEDDADEPAVPRYAPAAPGAPWPAAPAAVKVPREPWYYGFLVVVAQWTMGVGLAGCALAVLLGLFQVAFAIAQGGEVPLPVWYRVAPGVGLMVIGAASVIPVLLASAPVFLAVDAARNLRALRYGVR